MNKLIILSAKQFHAMQMLYAKSNKKAWLLALEKANAAVRGII